jgi:hypothetical protein
MLKSDLLHSCLHSTLLQHDLELHIKRITYTFLSVDNNSNGPTFGATSLTVHVLCTTSLMVHSFILHFFNCPRLVATSLTVHLLVATSLMVPRFRRHFSNCPPFVHHFFNGPLCAPLISPLNVTVPFSLAQSFEQFRILSLGCYGHNLDR